MSKMQRINCNFENKDLTNDESEFYEIEVVASTPDVDRHGDSVSVKALEGVAKNQKSVPMFFGHAGEYLKNILGSWEILGVENNALKLKGKMPKGLDVTDHAYKMLKCGGLPFVSIGFFPNQEKMQSTKTGYIFDEIDLVETSLVPVPANTNAKVTNVKQLENKEEIMEENQELMSKLEELLALGTEIKEMLSSLVADTTEAEEMKLEDEEMKSFMAKLGGSKDE